MGLAFQEAVAWPPRESLAPGRSGWDVVGPEEQTAAATSAVP